MKLFTVLFAFILLAGCSKKSDNNTVIPPTYITGISTLKVLETNGGYSLQIKYTVDVTAQSLQLIRDADNVTLISATQVQAGSFTTYDRNNYNAGAKYHFLVNNSIGYPFIAQ